MKNWKYILILLLALVFTTCKEEEPMVATLEIEEISITPSYKEAGVRCRINTTATVQELVMEYALDSMFKELKQAQMTKVNPKSDDALYQVTLQPLEENKQYYIRCRAVNKYSSILSGRKDFQTMAFHLPEVQTDSVTDITVSSAVLNATVLDRGTDVAPQVGFCVGDHPGVTMDDACIAYSQLDNKDTVSYALELMQLEDNVTYYIRAYAQNIKGVAYGQELSFKTTEILLPTLGDVSVPSSKITYTTAVVSGEVIADGGSEVIERGVCYSTSPNPTVESTKVSGGSGIGDFLTNLTDLTAGKTYYVRVYATNIKGTNYSNEVSFTTITYGKPTVTTGEVTNITYTSAKVQGEVTSDGGQEITERGICYSKTPGPSVFNSKVTAEGTTGSFSCTLEDLADGTNYFVRAYATNSQGVTYGEEVAFTTTAYGIPTVATYAVTDITYTTATGGGYVTADGGQEITERGVCYAIKQNPTVEDNKVTASGKLGLFNCSLTNLSDGTIYYVRAYAKNSRGIAYGNEVSFQTIGYNIPTVTTSAATNVSYTTATCGGNVTDDGDLTISERGICYSTVSNPTIENSKVTSTGTLGVFTCALKDLTNGTTYYFRAYATNARGTAYGIERSFTTTKFNAPTVTTTTPSNVTFTSAKCGGNVTSDGGSAIIERGVCYSTWQENPDKDHPENFKIVDSIPGTGSFTCELTELTSGLKYYVRAYAVNSEGVSYGASKTFTTQGYVLPTVSTSYAKNVTASSATLGGNVSDDGGDPNVERGICYSTETTEPTIDNNKIVCGSGTGSFTCDLTDLPDGTTYYFRAYATNAKGTAYGTYRSFTTTSLYVPTLYIDHGAYNVTYTSAKPYAVLSSTGGLPITEIGFCYSSESTEPTTADQTIKYSELITSGSYYCELTGLQDGTTYYYRGYAINEKGVGYSGVESFTTTAYKVPSVSLEDWAFDITYTSATCVGNISDDGGLEILDRGVCYSSTNSEPTINDTHVSGSSDTLLSPFTCLMEGLEEGSTYYYRVYATNSKGTGYGGYYYGTPSFTTKSHSLPSVSTQSYSDLSYTSVTVGGEVTSGDGLDIIERGICISRTNNYPTVEEDSVIVCGVGLGEFTHQLTNLQDGTYYNYRAYAKTVKGVGYGSRKSFTTTAYQVPSVSTKSSSDVTYTTATVGGEVTAEGGLDVIERGICISTTNSYPTVEEDSVIVCGEGLGEFTHVLTNLKDGTYYMYRAYAKSAKGVGYGSRESFTTSGYVYPSVSTAYYSNVSYTSATVGGNVTSGGGLDVLEYGICISRTRAYPTYEEDSVIVCGSGLAEFTYNLTNLADGTTYYYRAFAKTAYGVGYGGYESFTTKKFIVPSVSTKNYSDVSYTSATVGGNVMDENGHEVTERGICISRTNNYPTVEVDSVVPCGSGLGEFTHVLTNLQDGTYYKYRAYAKSDYGVGYGTDYSFTTKEYPRPSVSTYSVSEISYFSAKFYGWSNNLSEHPTIERGFCYATTENPTINDTKIIVTSTSSEYFEIVVDGLEAGTMYYVRAFATNEYGPKYGSEQTFTTTAYSVPTLTTNDATVVSFESAVCSGKVTAYGGKEVTAYGICYSTSQNPTINDYSESGYGDMTNFQCPLSGLNSNTTYYYRAYATNEEGTGYGEQKSFTTVDYDAAVIYYTASNKLNEVTSYTGLHTDAFDATIASHTFENGQGIIKFTNKITRIGNYAFEKCSEMTSVTLPYSITEIQYRAFTGCTGLTSLDIPENVQYLTPREAFDECYNLVSFTVHSSNQYFCDVDGVLFTKDKKTLLAYPAGRTATSYLIPSGVNYIEDRAFYKCKSLISVTIPQTVTNIRYDAFRECTGLTSITIPSSVTRLHGYTFYGCTSLTTVDIGYGVTNIDGSDFNGCPNIISVTCRAFTPPSGCGNFEAIDKAVVPLYVPNGFVLTYKNTSCWKEFTNILPIP